MSLLSGVAVVLTAVLLAGGVAVGVWLRSRRLRRGGELEFHDVTEFVLSTLAESRAVEQRREGKDR